MPPERYQGYQKGAAGGVPKRGQRGVKVDLDALVVFEGDRWKSFLRANPSYIDCSIIGEIIITIWLVPDSGGD